MKIVLALSLVGLFSFPIAQAQAPQPSERDATRSRTEVVVPIAPDRTTSASAPASMQPAVHSATAARPVVAASVSVSQVQAPSVVPAPAPSKQVAAAVSTPAPAPAHATPAAPASTFARTVEAEIFRLINIERTKQGLSALAPDAKLDAIARAHSQDMLDNHYFSHTDLSGCNSSCRVTKTGYTWSAVGENIYTMSGYNLSAQETAQHMVEGWMNSPEHRANILNAAYTNHGIGVATSGSTIYATSEFALPQ